MCYEYRPSSPTIEYKSYQYWKNGSKHAKGKSKHFNECMTRFIAMVNCMFIEAVKSHVLPCINIDHVLKKWICSKMWQKRTNWEGNKMGNLAKWKKCHTGGNTEKQNHLNGQLNNCNLLC
ncbi:hypothetical protein POVCU1_012630 [Plasmodium ovale curtisi]|uniref:Uncharacterized protein n=1 Tax=Plasmodium ovale curtisi TaxID=864141 RepID=A0A1A8W1I7_PLAOA|nr:hypothetical protein POVCU1_012630 [Plasmodium ovale curtisi]